MPSEGFSLLFSPLPFWGSKGEVGAVHGLTEGLVVAWNALGGELWSGPARDPMAWRLAWPAWCGHAWCIMRPSDGAKRAVVIDTLSPPGLLHSQGSCWPPGAGCWVGELDTSSDSLVGS